MPNILFFVQTYETHSQEHMPVQHTKHHINKTKKQTPEIHI